MFELRQYSEGDEAKILELFAVTFGRKLDEKTWRWRYGAENPAGTGVICLAWDGENLAGHYALARARMTSGGRSIEGSLSMTTMVHPDYRRRGLFLTLARGAYDMAREGGVELVYGFPNENSQHGFFTKLDWENFGDLVEMESRKGGELEASGVELRRLRDRADLDGATIFASWSEADLALTRDSAYLEWRYNENPDAEYEILSVEVDGSSQGVVVVKMYRGETEIKAHLMDWLVEGDRSFQAVVLSAVSAHCFRRGAAVTTCWSPSSMSLHPVMQSAGFQPSGRLTHFGGLVFPGSDLSMRRETMFVSLGDSDVF